MMQATLLRAVETGLRRSSPYEVLKQPDLLEKPSK